MKDNYYLPEGHTLGGHYEIVKVLGEDEFEILYLVKDKHRLESLFVIKELFLKAYAKRENETVQVMAKSKLLFEDTKKEMIDEIITAQKNSQNNQVQTYGYLEENNTVYTIMEFVNDSNVAHYLQNNAVIEDKKEEKRDEIVLPPIKNYNKKESVEVDEPIVEKEKKPKSYIFLKMLSLAVLVMLGLAYYSWDMIKRDKERVKEKQVSVVTERTIHTPPLNDRDEEKLEPIVSAEKEEKKEIAFNASYIEEEEQKVNTKDDVFDIPNEEVYVDEEKPKVEEELKQEEYEVKEENPNSLGTQIGGENTTERFNRMSVKRFLDTFIASSTSGSIDDIVSHYDAKVDRYFSLKNINHNKIRKDKVSYQKRWTKREFRLVAFKIISIYRKGNFDYCDLSTTTQWNVSSDDFKTASGISKGLMTLKRTYDGFKVTSIYTVK